MTSVTLNRVLSIAMEHRRAGRLAEAQSIYRELLGRRPSDAQLLHLLGMTEHQMGHAEAAAHLFQKAIAVNSMVPEFYTNLGEAYRVLGRTEEAVAAHRHAIALKPDFAQGHYNLGVALQNHGRPEEAIAAYRQAVAYNPTLVEAYVNLGAALEDRGRGEEAIAAYRRAIALKPDFAEAYTNLGNALRDRGDLQAAVAAHQRAVALRPDLGAVHSNLGIAMTDQGLFDQAIAAHRQAVALDPGHAERCYNLGAALQRAGQSEEAITVYRRAIALDPNYPQAHSNLGKVLADRGELDGAVAAYRQAIALKPDYAEAYSNLGAAWHQYGEVERAVESFRTALSMQDSPAIHSNLVYALHFHPEIGAAAILAEHREWNRRHAAALTAAAAPHANDRTPDRRLRLGYIGPYFRDHVVGRNLLPVLECHDHTQFEIFCYSNSHEEDPITDRMRRRSDHWRGITELGDAQVAEIIRADGIDVLVDLAQHMADNRMRVMAARPAPVQVAHMGYPATTGVAAIDYRVTDPYLDAPGTSEADNTEKLARLRHSFWCYPSEVEEPVCPPPALANGFVTFGSLNNLTKVNSRGIELWSQLLRHVPNSRLLLLTPGPGSVEGSLRARFESHGIPGSRLRFAPKCPRAAYFKLYGQIDIGLDPIPYNGHSTSCDSFWMGVPVVTLRGPTSVGRSGVSILSTLGLKELIAATPEEYVRIAGELAGDVPRVEKLRQGMRQRMRASALTDADGYTRDLEGLYRQMWRDWCASQP